jgi:oligopeptidase B
MQAAEEVLLDGNRMAQGLEYFELGGWEVSPDGRLLAFTSDTVGRRQFQLCVKDLASGQMLDAGVANVEPEVAWAGDSRTVLYIEKDPETLLSVRLKAHQLGSEAASDRLLYEEADHSYYLGVGKSRSERYLLLSCTSTEQSQWWYADRDDPELRFRSVLPREAGHEYDVDHRAGDGFVLRSNWLAPNFRIVHVPIATSKDRSTWSDVLPHREDTYIEDFEVASAHLAINVRSGGLLQLHVHDWSGARIAAVGAPDASLPQAQPARAVMLVATPGVDSALVRYETSSLTAPGTIYDLDVASGRSQWKKTRTVLGGFDAANYDSLMRTATARDGTPIPVSIAWRRGTPRDGTAPLYQYGYGAYGYSVDPVFRPNWISLMDRGFVVAIAHVRGGQELGRPWYDAGRLLNKMNTFTDFIDVTGMLVDEGYAAADRVCAQGGSAGGLLMGAIANLAPERYRAIVAHVPFVDVVTTMLDETIPLTTNEFEQWGDPRERRYYDYMLRYSPYDNVAAQDYPALLVFTGLWDSQVQYFEPAKWVARLRALKTDRRPLLFSVDLHAGHGGKSGRFQHNRETAREYAFLLWQAQALPGGGTTA